MKCKDKGIITANPNPNISPKAVSRGRFIYKITVRQII